VIESTPVAPDAKWKHYKYLWWMSASRPGRYTAVGNLGQFIFVAPDKDCVIVRLGRGKPSNWKMVCPRLFGELLNGLRHQDQGEQHKGGS
jgi:CubicO group peptidase (beta-lactamase class C family)